MSSVHTHAPADSEQSFLIRGVKIKADVLEVSGNPDVETNHQRSEQTKESNRTDFYLHINFLMLYFSLFLTIKWSLFFVVFVFLFR